MLESTSLIVPIKKHAELLDSGLQYLFENLKESPEVSFNIIVVDDGSEEEEEIYLICKKFNATYIRHEVNLGKGASICTGVRNCNTEYFVYTDCDFPFFFTDLKNILKSLESFSISIGDRYKERKSTSSVSLHRKIASSVFRLLTSIILGLEGVDNQCGLKGFKTRIAKDLFNDMVCSRYAFDAELLYRASHFNILVDSVPVRLRYNGESTLSIYADAPKMLIDLVKIRFLSLRKFSLKLDE